MCACVNLLAIFFAHIYNLFSLIFFILNDRRIKLISAILNKCNNYFSASSKLDNLKNNSITTNILIFSYFTIVIPLGIGVVYVTALLINRISHLTDLSREQARVDVTGRTALQRQYGSTRQENKLEINFPHLAVIKAKAFFDYVVLHNRLVIKANTQWMIEQIDDYIDFAPYERALNGPNPHTVFEKLTDELLLLTGKRCKQMSSEGRIEILLDPNSRCLTLESDHDITLDFGYDQIQIDPFLFFKRMVHQKKFICSLEENQKIVFYLNPRDGFYGMDNPTLDEMMEFLNRKIPSRYKLHIYTPGKMKIGVTQIIETGEKVLVLSGTKKLQIRLSPARIF
jgi:hypothetical protein